MATVLIIDDQESIRALPRATLEAAGHEVMEASNGHIGLDLYRQKPTDLVITDILMSELNGLDMIVELTREFLDAKVIAISGSGEGKNVLGHAKLLGARRTFRKPFSMTQLLWMRCDTNWNTSAACSTAVELRIHRVQLFLLDHEAANMLRKKFSPPPID
jgi:two-component system response regulator (stage 0 sporulation protein F)